MCIINKNSLSATKSTSMKRKLSKSNVSSHEMNLSFHETHYAIQNPRLRTSQFARIQLFD